MLTIYGWVDNTTGYGRGTIALYRAALEAGIDVEFMPLPGLPVILPSDLESARLVDYPTGNLILAHCTPPQLWPLPKDHTVLLYSMFERTQLPTEPQHNFGGNWVEQINKRVDAVYCPSNFAVDVMKRSGVTVPVAKLEYPMQFSEIPYAERQGRATKVAKVGVYGDLDERKNPRAVCAAVEELLAEGFPIELELKHNGGSKLNYLNFEFPFVKIHTGNWPRAQLLEWLSGLDVFVWLSRGEGLSLPPMEALVNGCPLIVANNTGMADWIQSANTIAIDCKEIPAPEFGNWFEASAIQTESALRKIVVNALSSGPLFDGQGQKARTAILNRYTLGNAASQIRKVVEQWQK